MRRRTPPRHSLRYLRQPLPHLRKLNVVQPATVRMKLRDASCPPWVKKRHRLTTGLGQLYPQELSETFAQQWQQCRDFLLPFMQNNQPKYLTKDELRVAAMRKFNVSKNAFDMGWMMAIENTGRHDWYEPLRRRLRTESQGQLQKQRKHAHAKSCRTDSLRHRSSIRHRIRDRHGAVAGGGKGHVMRHRGRGVSNGGREIETYQRRR